MYLSGRHREIEMFSLCSSSAAMCSLIPTVAAASENSHLVSCMLHCSFPAPQTSTGRKILQHKMDAGWPPTLPSYDDVVWSEHLSLAANLFSWPALGFCQDTTAVWYLLSPATAGQEAESGGHLSVLTVMRLILFLQCMAWCHCVMIILPGFSGVSVTLCELCREACHWPDTKPCSSVTHHRPEVIKSKIALKELNSSHQMNTHTWLRYKSLHWNHETRKHLHKQSFPGNVYRDLDVFSIL